MNVFRQFGWVLLVVCVCVAGGVCGGLGGWMDVCVNVCACVCTCMLVSLLSVQMRAHITVCQAISVL